MALIKCPQCGNEISDKALECPSCGFEILKEGENEKEPIKCEECGKEIQDGAITCPSCGCPVTSDSVEKEKESQKVEVTNVNLPKSNKKKIKILVLVAIICVVGIIGNKFYKEKKADDDAKNAANVVVQMIDDLGTPEYYVQTDINSAEDAYNDLTEKAKEYVTNYKELQSIIEKPTHLEQVGINLVSEIHGRLYNPDSLEVFSLEIQDGSQDEKYNCALCTIDYSGMNKMGGQTRETENFLLWGKEAEYNALLSACGDSLSVYSEFIKLGNKMPYEKIKVDPERIMTFIK